jgi:zinc protease
MRRKVLCNILFLLAAIIMGTMGKEIHAREGSPYLHKQTLDNGITTIVKEVPGSKVATVQLWVKAGSVYEEPGEAGITHVIEHMIFKGTPTRGPGEVAGSIESIGGQLNAYTSYEYTVYHATLAADHWELAMEVLTDAVLNSTFDPEELEREKKVVLEEIRMRNDRPEIGLFEAMMSNAYLHHPYRRPVIGSVESVSAISREDILAYQLKHYRPENFTAIVVGDVRAEKVIAKVKELMAGLDRQEYEQPPLPAEPVQEEARFFKLTRDINQTHLALAIPVTPFEHPDSAVLDVIAQILGKGEASRLHHQLRNQKGLVYRIDASSFTPLDQGVFSITAILSAEKAETALEAILEELFKLRYLAVGDEELERAKRNMESDFIFNLERVEGQARVLGAFEFISGDPREDEYLARIRTVSREDIQRVATTYFRPDRITAGLLAPAAAELDLDQPALVEITRRADEQARHGMPASLIAEAFLPDVHRFELENGAILLVRENPQIPTVSIRVVFPGGLRAESAATNGAFAFISQMLPRGTARMDARELSLEVANMAGELSGFNGKNTFGLRADFLSRFFEPGLELVRDVLREPAFSPEEMEKVRPELLSHLRQQMDSLPALAFKEFNERLFQGHPYGLNNLGSEAAIAQLTAADLKRIYQQQALPERMVIAVAGQVKAEEVREAVAGLFGDWTSPPRAARSVQEEILPPLPPAAAESHTVVRDREQVHIVIGFLGVSLTSQERYGLEIIDTLLSGQSGRLFTELRDRQSLAYSLSSFSLLGLDTGSFGVYIGTGPEKREEAVQAMWQELRRLREELVDADTLQRAKNIIIGRYQLGLQTHGAQAMDLALIETYGLGHDFGNRYIAEISAVDAAEVLEIARKLINPDQYVMVSVGADVTAIEPAPEPVATGGAEE